MSLLRLVDAARLFICLVLVAGELTVLSVLAHAEEPLQNLPFLLSPGGVQKNLLTTQCPGSVQPPPGMGCPQNLIHFAANTQTGCGRSKVLEGVSASELEAQFQRTPEVSLGRRSGWVSSSSCLGQAFLTESKSQMVVSAYYSLTQQIRDGLIEIDSNIGEINSELMESPLADWKCGDDRLMATKSHCAKLAKCPAVGGVQEEAKALEEDYPIYEELKKRMVRARVSLADNRSRETELALKSSKYMKEREDLNAEIADLKEKLDTFRGLHPRVDGPVFKSKFSRKKANFAEALRAQRVADRNALQERKKNYHLALSCINEQTVSKECQNFLKLIEGFPEGLGLEKKHNDRSGYWPEAGVAQWRCVRDDVTNQVEKNKAIDEFTTNLIWTLGTAGMSELVLLTRVSYAALGARTLSAASAAVRVAELAAQTEVARRRYLLVKTVFFGASAFHLSEQLDQSFDQCSKEWSKLKDFAKNTLSTSAYACPTNDGLKGPSFSGNFRNCMIGAIASSLPALLPLASTATRGMANELRVARVEKLLGRELTRAQKDALTEANFFDVVEPGAKETSTVKPYLETLKERENILKAAAFSDGERETLMRGKVLTGKGVVAALTSQKPAVSDEKIDEVVDHLYGALGARNPLLPELKVRKPLTEFLNSLPPIERDIFVFELKGLRNDEAAKLLDSLAGISDQGKVDDGKVQRFKNLDDALSRLSDGASSGEFRPRLKDILEYRSQPH